MWTLLPRSRAATGRIFFLIPNSQHFIPFPDVSPTTLRRIFLRGLFVFTCATVLALFRISRPADLDSHFCPHLLPALFALAPPLKRETRARLSVDDLVN